MQYHMSIYWNFKVNWICIVNKRQISILCTHSKYMGWYIILVHEILQLFFKNFDISFFFLQIKGPWLKKVRKRLGKVKWPSNGNEFFWKFNGFNVFSGKVAKQWKRMQGSSSAPNTSYPEGGSIGKSNHFLFFVLCCSTVCCGLKIEGNMQCCSM